MTTDNLSASTGIDLTMMYVAHRAFRRDLDRLAGQLDDTTRRDRWQLFTRQLHAHHRAEDVSLWPRLQERCRDDAAALDTLAAMEAEHAAIDPLLAEVDRDPGTGLDALTTHLGAHLEHEEQAALPLVRERLTAADWRGFLAEVRRANGLSGAREFFPWMIEAAPAAEAEAVCRPLPAPLRILVRRRWVPAYERKHPW
jgi:hypothetical protein